jgi:hypothetical protein
VGIDNESPAEEITLEEALVLRRSVQIIEFLISAIPEKDDPVSKGACREFALSLVAELATLVPDSRLILRMAKNILPRA